MHGSPFFSQNPRREPKTIIFFYSSEYEEPQRWLPSSSVFITCMIYITRVTPLHLTPARRCLSKCKSDHRYCCRFYKAYLFIFLFFFPPQYSFQEIPPRKDILQETQTHQYKMAFTWALVFYSKDKHTVNNLIYILLSEHTLSARKSRRSTPLLCLFLFMRINCYSAPYG